MPRLRPKSRRFPYWSLVPQACTLFSRLHSLRASAFAHRPPQNPQPRRVSGTPAPAPAAAEAALVGRARRRTTSLGDHGRWNSTPDPGGDAALWILRGNRVTVEAIGLRAANVHCLVRRGAVPKW